MVSSHHFQPEVVGDVQLLQQSLAFARMLEDRFLLRGAGFFALLGQLVLHGRHADVHGEGGAHQRIALMAL